MARPAKDLLRRVAVALGWALLLLLAMALDPLALGALRQPDAAAHDWFRLLRVMGFLPTWLALSLAMALQDRAWRRALPLTLAAGGAGALAELLKLLLRRERPGPQGEVVYRAWNDQPWDSAGLGMPSSHVAVAFGAAFLLARLHPRVAPVVLALATGCAMSRMMEGAHFLSDCAAASLVGWACARAVPLRQ